jgi:hypothetical protein
MNIRAGCKRRALPLALFAVALGAAATVHAATVLSSNLTATTSDVEAATSTRWLATSFGSSTSAMVLDSATLLLANPLASSATLSLYSDGGLQPGTLLATLASPVSYSATLASTTFTSGSALLAANTTYWLVLQTTSSSINWAWTSDNAGTGVGFQHSWGESDDAGVNWFTVDVYPAQLSVTASPIAADFNGSGSVTAADLAALTGSFGLTGSATHALGDSDGDLDVDGFDFLVFQRQLGVGGGASQVVGGPVPEPAGAAVALLAAIPLVLARRRRSRLALVRVNH